MYRQAASFSHDTSKCYTYSCNSDFWVNDVALFFFFLCVYVWTFCIINMFLISDLKLSIL